MMPRRVAVDVTSAVHQSGGIGRYTRCLVQALARRPPPFRLTLFWLAAPREPIPSWLLTVPNVRLRRIPVAERYMTIAWQRARLPLPIELFVGPQDVCHFPDFVMPPVWRARTVLTVHDLSFRRVPEAADPGLRRYLNKAVPRSVRQAELVLADSAATQRDLIGLMGARENKTAVLYSGVDQEFQPVRDRATLDAVRWRYRLPPRFILSLGTLQPRKNYRRLILAYDQLRRQSDFDWQLIIAGRPGWLYDDLGSLVAERGLRDLVHFVTNAADADLPALFSLADAFVLLSLYEGFGLPPLEAMACGTPVLVSNVSSLPEVVDEAGLQVDPLDIDAIAAALARLLRDSTLRQQLAKAGQQRAEHFTWQRAAEELVGHYAAVWTSPLSPPPRGRGTATNDTLQAPLSPWERGRG